MEVPSLFQTKYINMCLSLWGTGVGPHTFCMQFIKFFVNSPRGCSLWEAILHAEISYLGESVMSPTPEGLLSLASAGIISPTHGVLDNYFTYSLQLN